MEVPNRAGKQSFLCLKLGIFNCLLIENTIWSNDEWNQLMGLLEKSDGNQAWNMFPGTQSHKVKFLRMVVKSRCFFPLPI